MLLPAAALKGKKEFTVSRRDDTPLVYTSIEEMHEDFKNDKVCDLHYYLFNYDIERLLTCINCSSLPKISSLPSLRLLST